MDLESLRYEELLPVIKKAHDEVLRLESACDEIKFLTNEVNEAGRGKFGFVRTDAAGMLIITPFDAFKVFFLGIAFVTFVWGGPKIGSKIGTFFVMVVVAVLALESAARYIKFRTERNSLLRRLSQELEAQRRRLAETARIVAALLNIPREYRYSAFLAYAEDKLATRVFTDFRQITENYAPQLEAWLSDDFSSKRERVEEMLSRREYLSGLIEGKAAV
ncbi:MAG: hypothetical protein LBU36_00065 [Clostridiales bacterium]|jgi:hypothetical protein|nr:hypothetical protein [Clostridiales bacterium]